MEVDREGELKGDIENILGDLTGEREGDGAEELGRA
jgi:hypothetical protein